MIKSGFRKLLRDGRGASTIEMGLICALIVLGMMTALKNFAGESQITWSTISSKSQAAVQSATAS